MGAAAVAVAVAGTAAACAACSVVSQAARLRASRRLERAGAVNVRRAGGSLQLGPAPSHLGRAAPGVDSSPRDRFRRGTCRRRCSIRLRPGWRRVTSPSFLLLSALLSTWGSRAGSGTPARPAQAYWVNPTCLGLRLGAKPFFASVSPAFSDTREAAAAHHQQSHMGSAADAGKSWAGA